MLASDQISSDTYDDRDLRRLRTNDVYVATFIRGPNRLDEGVDLVHESLRFRKEYGVNGKKLKLSASSLLIVYDVIILL